MTTTQGPIVAGPVVVLTGDWLRVALQAVLTPTPTLLRHAETGPLNQQRPCNPPDAPQLAPAVQRVKKRAGQAPGTVTADRGYGEAKVDHQLTDLGVKNVVIPRKGKPSEERRAKEHRKPFRRNLVKISALAA